MYRVINRLKTLNHNQTFFKTAIGVSAFSALGVYCYFSKPRSIKIIGRPAPISVKTGSDPLVYPINVFSDEGQGNGLEGRSAPSKKKINIEEKSVQLEGYLKEIDHEFLGIPERQKFLNELIYHLLAAKVMEYHPKIKLAEKKISDTESEYLLFIESIGRNSPVNLILKNIKNKESTEHLHIEYIGCAIAFACLIRTTDAYLKNFIIVLNENSIPVQKAYAIDFEQSSDQDPILFINLNEPPLKAAKRVIENGGILEYTVNKTISQSGRVLEEGDSILGQGRFIYSDASSDLIFNSVASDIETGKIRRMYEKVASLTQEELDDILNHIGFIFETPEEKWLYRDRLQAIVTCTKSHLEHIRSQEQILNKRFNCPK